VGSVLRRRDSLEGLHASEKLFLRKILRGFGVGNDGRRCVYNNNNNNNNNTIMAAQEKEISKTILRIKL
jgi:hypothetical protein